MKYRIIDFCVRKTTHKKISHARRRVRVMALTVLTPVPYQTHNEYRESIDLTYLFEIGLLPEAKKPPKRARVTALFRRAFKAVCAFWAAVGVFIARCARAIFINRRAKHPRLAFFSGVLCSAVLCTVLSAAVVIVSLFGRFIFLPKNDLSQNEASENSDSIQVKNFYVIEDFRGKKSTLCLLDLKNKSIPFRLLEEYSDTAPRGTVISTTPMAGERLYDGQLITLTVSLGRQIKKVKVPDLYGLGESSARALLADRGLLLGSITYSVSSSNRGTVISQQYPPFDMIDEGSTVDITVSLGNINQKKVPDLWGLTLDEAKARLASVGLVVGGIFSAQSGAEAGKVISQFPSPDTPITSSITSVDLYISS